MVAQPGFYVSDPVKNGKTPKTIFLMTHLNLISLVSISEISRFQLASLAELANFCPTWLEIRNTGYFSTRLICFLVEGQRLSQGTIKQTNKHPAKTQIRIGICTGIYMYEPRCERENLSSVFPTRSRDFLAILGRGPRA